MIFPSKFLFQIHSSSFDIKTLIIVDIMIDLKEKEFVLKLDIEGIDIPYSFQRNFR